jgi:hypothetical protein
LGTRAENYLKLLLIGGFKGTSVPLLGGFKGTSVPLLGGFKGTSVPLFGSFISILFEFLRAFF